MENFKEYIRTRGAAAEAAEAERLAQRHPWFALARMAAGSCGDEGRDALLKIFAQGRATSSLHWKGIDPALLAEVTDDEIIDRFLNLGDYRIVAVNEEESSVPDDITTEATFADEDDLATEELAEIYAAQGLKDEAAEIYGKLSLLNPEKSVYFAEKIRKLETNN